RFDISIADDDDGTWRCAVARDAHQRADRDQFDIGDEHLEVERFEFALRRAEVADGHRFVSAGVQPLAENGPLRRRSSGHRDPCPCTHGCGAAAKRLPVRFWLFSSEMTRLW